MPLTFLIGDTGADRRWADAVLSHGGQGQWVRPYRPGPYRVAGGALLLMLASYLLLAALIVGLSGAFTNAGAILVGAATLIVFTLRLLRVGIWLGEPGLRQVALFRTVTVPWEQVASVRTSQQPVRWLGLPRTVQGQTVLVTRAGGEELRPLLTDHNADFLGRRDAFDLAADRVEDWCASVGGR